MESFEGSEVILVNLGESSYGVILGSHFDELTCLVSVYT